VEAASHSRHHVRHQDVAVVAPPRKARPDLIPGASQRFGDTNVTMSDTRTWFDES
jgi:hypothetical protein